MYIVVDTFSNQESSRRFIEMWFSISLDQEEQVHEFFEW